jgi:GTPase
VLVEDRLFSTLDATVRRLALPTGRDAVISDTVGFVRDLPHTIVEAFRSTLEEAVDTDLLVHVADASADDPVRQIDAVRRTLAEIGAGELPELLVVNKTDIASQESVRRLLALDEEAVAVSARTGHGLEGLLDAMEHALSKGSIDVELLVPFDRGDVVDYVHRVGEVLAEGHDQAGTRIKARLPKRHAASVERFVA